MSNLGSMIGVFSALTAGYIGLKYRSLTKNNSFSESYTMIYLLGVIIFSFIANMQTTFKLCGKNDYTTAFIITIIPWTLILGLLLMLLKSFPGWKAPFSNTFGYLVAKVMGAGKVIMELNPGTNDTELSKLFKKKVATVINVHSWPSVQENPLKLKKDGKQKIWTKFTHLVLLKDLIGEMIWYLLAGFLIISYQSSYITNNSCPAKLDKDGAEVTVDEAAIDKKKTVSKY